MSYRINKLVISCRQTLQYTSIQYTYLVLLIVMATCFGSSDHHMAIMHCNHEVWDPTILTVVQNMYKMLINV